MVEISSALFIFDEIMRPSVTTYVSEGPFALLCSSQFANFAYIVDSTNVPLKYFTVAFTPRVVLLQTNKRNFTGLRFEVEQASRGLSAVAELLLSVIVYCVCVLLLC